MAYLLGFIAADGNIELNKYNNPSRLNIILSSKDIGHLRKIKKMLSSSHSIKHHICNIGNKKYQVDSLRISSVDLCSSIYKLGIKNNKSLSIKWPNVPKKYISNFVRGYFDGDGSLHLRKNTKKPIITILGTLDILRTIQNEFIKIYGQKIGSIRKRHKIFALCFNGEPCCVSFLTWIYNKSDKNNRLKRKYDIFKLLVR